MIQFNGHLLVYSVIGYYRLIHMVAPKRAVFLSPAVSAMSNSLVWPAGFFFHSVLHWNFSWTSMPCLLPKNLKKSKQHYFWDNNLCEGVVLGKIEKKLEFNLILPIISILLKALRQLIQWKLRSLGVPPVNLKRERKPLQ